MITRSRRLVMRSRRCPISGRGLQTSSHVLSYSAEFLLCFLGQRAGFVIQFAPPRTRYTGASDIAHNGVFCAEPNINDIGIRTCREAEEPRTWREQDSS
jgi:hypothetical protein